MDEGYDAINIGAGPRPGGRSRSRRSRPRRFQLRGSARGRRRTRPPRRDRRPRAPPSTGRSLVERVVLLGAAGRSLRVLRLPEPRHARHVGRRPGPRHARAARARAATGRAAARATDIDRRRPPRRLVLLPALAGRGPHRRRLAAGRRRRSSRLPGSPRSASSWWLGARSAVRSRASSPGLAMAAVGRRHRRIDVHLEPEPHRAVERDRPRRGLAGVDRRRPSLVARRRHRHGGHDAMPRPRRRAAARRRRAVRRRRAAAPLGRRARRAASSRSSSIAYLPLLINELTTGGSEAAGGARLPRGRPRGSRDVALPIRFAIVGHPGR